LEGPELARAFRPGRSRMTLRDRPYSSLVNTLVSVMSLPPLLPLPRRIFLDLDGVLCDFASAAIRACGHEPSAVWARLEPGEPSWNFWTAMGLTPNDFYGVLEAQGERFWQHLEPYPGILDLVLGCQDIADTYFLTAPTLDPNSLSGKVRWLQSRFGRGTGSGMCVLARHKELLAGPGALLIDDREETVTKFRAAHGDAILVPRRWNSLHADEVEGPDQYEPILAAVRSWAELRSSLEAQVRREEESH